MTCPEFCSDMEMFPTWFSGEASCSISTRRASVHRLSPYQVMQQLFCSVFVNESSTKRKKLGVNGRFLRSISYTSGNDKKHSPFCSLGDVISWSHAGGEGVAMIMLQLSLQKGRRGTTGLRGPVSRLHWAGYHTVGGVR